MKYKNIVFDFGNVIGRFDPNYILEHYVHSTEDFSTLADAIFKNWPALDAGTLDYDQTTKETIASLPDYLKGTATDFYDNWFQYVTPLTDTWNLIHQLKDCGYSIYLLSNANLALRMYFPRIPGAQCFDKLMVSAEEKLLKPSHEIYERLYEKFGLIPEECFFIDDTPANVEGALRTGMEGTVFYGDVARLRRDFRQAGIHCKE